MELVSVNRRETYRYVDSYSHEDSWTHLGQLRVTPARQTSEGNGIDDAGTVVRYARIRRKDDFQLIRRGLEDSMTRQGCHHEYDCCGCVSYTTRVTRIRPSLLLIRTRIGRNY